MSTLIKVAQTPTTTADLERVATLFAQSGIFADTKGVAQAFVKIQAGHELGITPFASMSGIHIIGGKPTVGANLMAGRVKASGKYDYVVEQQDETVCRISFYEGKKKLGVSSFSIEDAKKAGTKNLDKFARNMLFARAISNGVRWYCPDIFAGPVYTPEEMTSAQDAGTFDVPAEVIAPGTSGLDEDIVYSLEGCATIEQLAAAWKAIPKGEKAKYLSLKDAMKAEIESQALEVQDVDSEEVEEVDEL